MLGLGRPLPSPQAGPMVEGARLPHVGSFMGG